MAGENVVVEGQHKLTPGMKVRPEEETFSGERIPVDAGDNVDDKTE